MSAIVALLIHGTGAHGELVPGRRLLAVDAGLLALRPRLAWSIGLDAHEAVDDALVAFASREPILLVARRGLDETALLDALDGPVVRVDLDAENLTGRRAAELFALRDARVAFTTRRIARARIKLDEYRDRVRTVRLVPLAARRGDILRMLAVLWRELGTRTTPDALSEDALRALVQYDWPGNIAELRAQARRVLALHECGTYRAAAQALGIAHQTLCRHVERLGLPVHRRDE